MTRHDRNLFIAGACGAVVGLMVAASYAAVPFYNWFCRTTGFAGTTQVATAAPAHELDRKITVRFDANVAAGLPWRFDPEVRSIDLKLGEVATVVYHVTNLSARDTWVQRRAAHCRGLFRQDQLLLLHRATSQGGREAGHDRRVLCGSSVGEGFGARRPQHHHPVLYLLSGARALARCRGDFSARTYLDANQ